jgi:2-keto-4-pentenoate hydratase/2-oxohepta-3-ene-1,7-dioic acid hydratase in catechol pathway
MKLALYDGNRPGVVVDDDRSIVDLSPVIDADDRDPLTAGWWRALCRDWQKYAEPIAALADGGERIPLELVRLDPPALAPSKVIAAASNYRAHVDEMHGVQERTLGTVHSWMMEFDVFLKASSSITGPAGPVVLPPDVLEAGHEIHHESELVVVIGSGGKDLSPSEAAEAILGFTAGLDITVRSPADRSRRKSYDTFSPLGPWIRVRDDEFDGSDLDILLTVDGQVRQSVNTADLITPVAEIVSYASRIMTLNPGDLIFTGAPPGVGPIERGETLVTSISGIGTMTTSVV